MCSKASETKKKTCEGKITRPSVKTEKTENEVPRRFDIIAKSCKTDEQL